MSSNIEWTDETWNPVVGCTPVSPGCLNCYAATMARRLEGMGKAEYQPRQDAGHTAELLKASDDGRRPVWERISAAADGSRSIRIAEIRAGRAVFTGEVRCLEDRLGVPLRWKKPRMIFVNSMSDLFHEDVPFEFIDKVFAVMALCPQHTFQVLTKRPERMAEYLKGLQAAGTEEDVWSHLMFAAAGGNPRERASGAHWIAAGRSRFEWPMPNVWLGASVEDQPRADERIPHLLRCPAAVRFLSVEPMIGPVELLKAGLCIGGTDMAQIHWVIVGGESGPKAREFEEAWARSIVDQCKGVGVPVFVKQLGAVTTIPEAQWRRDSDAGRTRLLSYRNRERTRPGMVAVETADPKGANMDAWPEDLRVREWPRVEARG